MLTIRNAHALSALILSTFAFMHIGNHLMAVNGADAHTAFLNGARQIYRQPFIEAVLVLSVAFQICSGLALFFRGASVRNSFKGRDAWIAKIQAVSGIYLAVFLSIHVAAIFVGRHAFHLNTNFYFAAAGFHVMPFPFFFAPYYFFAVLAIFIHLACAGYWHIPASVSNRWRMTAFITPIVFGTAVAMVIVLCLAGILIPLQMPAEYLAPYHIAD